MMIGQTGCLPKMGKQDINFPASFSSEKSDAPNFASKSVYVFADNIIFIWTATIMQKSYNTLEHNSQAWAWMLCWKASAKNSMNPKYFYLVGGALFQNII